MSLDVYVAGPGRSPVRRLGVGGEQLHEWTHELAAWRRDADLAGGVTNACTAVREVSDSKPRALVMGLSVFGGGPGPWDQSWIGWRGEEASLACWSSW